MKQWLSCSKRRRRDDDIRDYGKMTYLPSKSGRTVSGEEVHIHHNEASFKVPDFQQPSLKSFVSSMKAKKNLERWKLSSHKANGVPASVFSSGVPASVFSSGVPASAFSSGVRKKVVSSNSKSGQDYEELWHNNQKWKQKEETMCAKKEENKTQEKKRISNQTKWREKQTKKKHAHHKRHTLPDVPVTSRDHARTEMLRMGAGRKHAHHKRHTLPDVPVTSRDHARMEMLRMGAGRKQDGSDRTYKEEDKENRNLLCGTIAKAHIHLSRTCGDDTIGQEERANVSCTVPVIRRLPLSEKNAKHGWIKVPGTRIEGNDQRPVVVSKAGEVERMDSDLKTVEGADNRKTPPPVMEGEVDLGTAMVSETDLGAGLVEHECHIDTDELLAELSYCEKLSV